MSEDKDDLKSIKVYKFNNTKEGWHEFALKFCSHNGGGGQTPHSSTSNLKWTQILDPAAEQTNSVVFLRSPWHTQHHLHWQLGLLHYQLQSPLTYRSTDNKGMHWKGTTKSFWPLMPRTVDKLIHSWKQGSWL